MKIKKTYVFAAFALITGIIGAVLRANYLLTGFEAETGLPVRSENRYETALFVLSAFVFIVFFIFSVNSRKKPGDCCGEEICSLNGAGLLLRVLSAFLMLLASVFGFCQFMLNNGLAFLFIALLSFISGIGVISLTVAQKRKNISSEHRLCATFPVLWVAFLLIYFYREHSANPIFGSYSYELFALALAMMAVFYFSGTFFGRNYPRRAFFTSFASVYMVLVAFFSRAAYCAVNGMLFFVPDYENLLWLCASASILFFILAVCAEPQD